MYEKLRQTIFETCKQPIMECIEKKNFSIFDAYYGPLFTVLSNNWNSTYIKQIFTTNWDLCLKEWMNYANQGYQDGTSLDPKKNLVLDPQKGWNDQDSPKFSIVPMHGSLDLIEDIRLVDRSS